MLPGPALVSIGLVLVSPEPGLVPVPPESGLVPVSPEPALVSVGFEPVVVLVVFEPTVILLLYLPNKNVNAKITFLVGIPSSVIFAPPNPPGTKLSRKP